MNIFIFYFLDSLFNDQPYIDYFDYFAQYLTIKTFHKFTS